LGCHPRILCAFSLGFRPISYLSASSSLLPVVFLLAELLMVPISHVHFRFSTEFLRPARDSILFLRTIFVFRTLPLQFALFRGKHRCCGDAIAQSDISLDHNPHVSANCYPSLAIVLDPPLLCRSSPCLIPPTRHFAGHPFLGFLLDTFLANLGIIPKDASKICPILVFSRPFFDIVRISSLPLIYGVETRHHDLSCL